MSARIDPVLGFNFNISLVDSSSTLSFVFSVIAPTPLGGFSECSGLETTLEVEDYKEGGNNGGVLKFPTRTTWSNIRLKRGLVDSDALWQWHDDYVQGIGTRRDGIITLQNEQQQTVKSWRFKRGLPLKWVGPTLNAAQNQVAIEELEIAHEGIKLLPSGFAGAFFGPR
jgi:phage tail-like protein